MNHRNKLTNGQLIGNVRYSLAGAQERELPQMRTALTNASRAAGAERRLQDTGNIDLADELIKLHSIAHDLECLVDHSMEDIRAVTARLEQDGDSASPKAARAYSDFAACLRDCFKDLWEASAFAAAALKDNPSADPVAAALARLDGNLTELSNRFEHEIEWSHSNVPADAEAPSSVRSRLDIDTSDNDAQGSEVAS